MTVYGADLSSFQSGISLAAVKAAGAQFVVVKATEGLGYISPVFRAQAQAAAAQGLVVSAYHFMRPGDGAGQAAHFLDVIAGVIPASVRVWADFEAASHDDLHAFLTAVQAAGRPVGVYTGSWYWEPNGSSTCTHCASLPLWQAAYQAGQPAPLRPWSAIAMWQFTDKYPVGGWAAGVDMSETPDLSVLLTAPAPEEDDDMTPELQNYLDMKFKAQADQLAAVGAQVGAVDYAIVPPKNASGVDILTQGELTLNLRESTQLARAIANGDVASVVDALAASRIAQAVLDGLAQKLSK